MTYTHFETEDDLIRRGVLPETHTNQDGIKFIPKRLRLQWHITEDCNLRCQHCYQWDMPQSKADNGNAELSLDGMLEVLERYIYTLKTWGISGHINFTGGEPFVKPWFLDLLTKVYHYREFCSFAILTNGTLLDGQTAKELKRLSCKFIQVSLDGNPQTHDKIRTAGNFEQTLETLKLLRKRRISTMVSFTVHRDNYYEFAEVARICRDAKVDVLWSDRLLPLGRGAQWREQLLHPWEVEAFFTEMSRLRSTLAKDWGNRTQLRMHRALQFLALQKAGEKKVIPYRCSAGKSFLTVLATGAIVPCRRMPVVVGWLTRQSLTDVFYQSILLWQLRNPKRIAEGCETCEYRDACNGGLRCLAYSYYGTPFKADPQCFKLYHQLPPPG